MNLLDKINFIIDLAFDKNERPLSLRAAAEYLDVSRSFLYKMVSNRQITHSKPNGKLIYFKKSDLDQFAFSKKIEINANKS